MPPTFYFFILVFLLFLIYQLSKSIEKSKKDEEAQKQKEIKENLEKDDNYYSLLVKANNLYYDEKYAEAISAYEYAVSQKSKTLQTDEVKYKIAACYFHLKEFPKVINDLKNLEGDQFLLRARSHFELGEFELSRKLFIAEIQNGNTKAITHYDLYFNPHRNDILYWNLFDNDTKLQLKRNINPNLNTRSTRPVDLTISKDDILLINKLDFLDFRLAWETWLKRYYPYQALIRNSHLTTIEFCKYLPNIQQLNLSGQKRLRNLDGIEYLVKLKDLNAENTEIGNMDKLSLCKSLENLSLAKSKNINLSAIVNLNIKRLDLSFYNKEDLHLLNKMRSLRKLSLLASSISSLKQIKELDSLEWLDVSCSTSFVLSPDYNLKSLKTLITSSQSEENIKQFNLKFPSCIVLTSLKNEKLFEQRR